MLVCSCKFRSACMYCLSFAVTVSVSYPSMCLALIFFSDNYVAWDVRFASMKCLVKKNNINESVIYLQNLYLIARHFQDSTVKFSAYMSINLHSLDQSMKMSLWIGLSVNCYHWSHLRVVVNVQLLTDSCKCYICCCLQIFLLWEMFHMCTQRRNGGCGQPHAATNVCPLYMQVNFEAWMTSVTGIIESL